MKNEGTPEGPPAQRSLLTSGRFASVLLRPGALVSGAVRRNPLFLFAATLVSTAVCLLAGNLLFPKAAGLVAVALLALSLLNEMVAVLEENRDAIWTRREKPVKANLRLAAKIVAVFLGMFVGFGAMTFVLSEETARTALSAQLASRTFHGIEEVAFVDPWTLLSGNAMVLLACLLFGIFFRAGGALLVLGWNASVWGAVYGALTRAQPSGKLWYGARVFLATGPHVLLESGSYVLAALAGIFLSKALAKYGLDSDEFWRVAWSAFSLLIVSAGILAAAAWAEALGAPWLAHRLF